MTTGSFTRNDALQPHLKTRPIGQDLRSSTRMMQRSCDCRGSTQQRKSWFVSKLTFYFVGGTNGSAVRLRGDTRALQAPAQNFHRIGSIGPEGVPPDLVAEHREARSAHGIVDHLALVAARSGKGLFRVVAHRLRRPVPGLRLHQVRQGLVVHFHAVVVHLIAGLEVLHVALRAEPVARACEMFIPEINPVRRGPPVGESAHFERDVPLLYFERFLDSWDVRPPQCGDGQQSKDRRGNNSLHGCSTPGA